MESFCENETDQFFEMDCISEEEFEISEKKLKKQEKKDKKRQEDNNYSLNKEIQLKETPTKKIKLPIDAYKDNICLVLPETFYPLHSDHIKILEQVRQIFSTMKNYDVIGGYFIPLHNSTLKR